MLYLLLFTVDNIRFDQVPHYTQLLTQTPKYKQISKQQINDIYEGDIQPQLAGIGIRSFEEGIVYTFMADRNGFSIVRCEEGDHDIIEYPFETMSSLDIERQNTPLLGFLRVIPTLKITFHYDLGREKYHFYVVTVKDWQFEYIENKLPQLFHSYREAKQEEEITPEPEYEPRVQIDGKEKDNTLVFWDYENFKLVGKSGPTDQTFQLISQILSRYKPIDAIYCATSQGFSQNELLKLKQLTKHPYTLVSLKGTNSVDMDLINRATRTFETRTAEKVVIISGDAIFSEIVLMAQENKADVTLISHKGQFSRSFWEILPRDKILLIEDRKVLNFAEQELLCKYCGYPFLDKSQISAHNQEFHVPRKCRICDILLKGKNGLKIHGEEFHTVCKVCDSIFGDENALQQHKRSKGH